MKFAIPLLACLFLFVSMKAQPGCTDPQALNFDPTATQNDGSCSYPPTVYFPEELAQLPTSIPEASGLAFFGGQLWLQQDGGAGSLLFTIDTLTAALLQTYPLPSLTNTDWEDLAEDATHLYVGDFGNNLGNRTDLRIYKISKNDLLAGTATAEVIDFAFSDQTDFTPANQATRHDCEAFFAMGDSLHLFSKDWLDYKTRHYVLPKTPGNHLAQLRDSLDTGCLVTAADAADDGTLALLGYDGNTSETSLWLLWDYPGAKFFHGNKRKISLGTALNMSQAEGIAFSSPSEGFICAEKVLVFPQRLLRFDIGQWVENPSLATESSVGLDFSASPNPFADFLELDFQGVVKKNAAIALLDVKGRLLRSEKLQIGKNRLETVRIPAGTYFLAVKNGEEKSVTAVIKY